MKKTKKKSKEEVCTLRESIRDQKYPKGFMKTDFPEMTEDGLAHSNHLKKPIPIYTGEPSVEHWSRIKGTRCVVRAMDSWVKDEVKKRSKKVKQGS